MYKYNIYKSISCLHLEPQQHWIVQVGKALKNYWVQLNLALPSPPLTHVLKCYKIQIFLFFQRVIIYSIWKVIVQVILFKK